MRLLVRRYGDDRGIKISLIQKLNAAEAAASRGQEQTKQHVLNAFLNQIQAEEAALLRVLAKTL